MHGLGGSLEQFHPLLTSLTNVAPCLGIDLPGCGLSKFVPKDWDAYTTEALVELLEVVIQEHCVADQGIVLIAHSMGCSFSALLASETAPRVSCVKDQIFGVVAICPPATPPTQDQVTQYRRLFNIPEMLFDVWRMWDRRGGIESPSVSRFVGSTADVDTKKMQVRFNARSKTPVFRRMAWGSLPSYDQSGKREPGGLPGREVWSGLQIPVFLVAGEADAVTRPEEIAKISSYLGKPSLGHLDHVTEREQPIPTTSDPLESMAEDSHQTAQESRHLQDEEVYGIEPSQSESLVEGDQQSDLTSAVLSTPRKVVKTSILPTPASHGLLFAHGTYRTLAGLIQSFLADHIDPRLSLGWQLQHLTTSGKWDVKNLAKWQGVTPVSKPINRTFRALKTLREIDDRHSPVQFVKEWKGRIQAVIDISHESPVYNPQELEEGGIKYHKLPTVSKIPPTPDEVRDFIALVDRLRAEIPPLEDVENAPLIGVHCHYGFNRTGFFIVSYLVEKEGFAVQEAIDEFEKKRPPGIRHEHFIDTLFARYCVGLKRAPTI